MDPLQLNGGNQVIIKVSDYVAQFIAAQGVRHIFFLPGGGAMHLVDSIGREEALVPVCMLHEQAAAIATEAYAMHSENLGVALVTTGPGGTNTVTGVAAAWIDSTPCMFISGQVKRDDLNATRGVRQYGMQEVDIVSIVRQITKYAATVLDPGEICYHLEKAVYEAHNGRPGPVWIDIPLDVQGAMIDTSNLKRFTPPHEKYNEDLLNQNVENILELLNKSKRPLILAGNGIRLAKAEDAFLEFLNLIRIPVLTTWKAMDLIPEDFPFYAGRAGLLGERGSNFALQNSDFLLCLGSRMDASLTGYDHSLFARQAKKVIVDIDPSELAKLEDFTDIAVACDVGIFIRKLAARTSKLPLNDISWWINKITFWRNKYPVVQKDYWENEELVNPYVLVDSISSEASPDDIVVFCSSGTAVEIACQTFKVKRGQKIRSNHGLGSMGFDIPASIGACLANNCRRTICITGDGGIQLNIQELETIRRLNLPIKLFVLNNKGYASIRAMQRNHFEGRYVGSNIGSGLILPDMTRISEAYNIPSMRIHNHRDLVSNIKISMNLPGPMICDVLTIPDFTVTPRVASRVRSDGSMVSTSLEDQWPFLDKEILLSNMLIPLVTNQD